MAENVVKVSDEDNIDISNSNKQVICFFCYRDIPKYTCPRCSVCYCSSTCYKSEKHLKCSEDFYRESVVQELTSRAKDPKDVQNVLKMIKTLEEQDYEHHEPCDPLIEERFADINLNTADVDVIWNTLTREEQKEFEERVRLGEMSDLVDGWIPWWQQDDHRSNKHVEVISPGDTKEQSSLEQLSSKQKPSFPKVLEKIPSITGAANPLIKYSIVNVLYSYVYLMRLYNGEPEENLHPFASGLYELSSSLSKNLSFDSVEVMVHDHLNSVQQNNDFCNWKEFSYSALLDVCDLLTGKHVIGSYQVDFIDCALSDIITFFSKAKKAIKCEKGGNKEEEKKLFFAKKKVEFFLSWVQSKKQVLYSLVSELQAIYCELMSNCKIHDREKRKVDGSIRKMVNRRKLIQEL